MPVRRSSTRPTLASSTCRVGAEVWNMRVRNFRAENKGEEQWGKCSCTFFAEWCWNALLGGPACGPVVWSFIGRPCGAACLSAWTSPQLEHQHGRFAKTSRQRGHRPTVVMIMGKLVAPTREGSSAQPRGSDEGGIHEMVNQVEGSPYPYMC